jgi:hypothetical protein
MKPPPFYENPPQLGDKENLPASPFFLKRLIFPFIGFIGMVIGLLYILYFAEGPSSPSSIPLIRAECGPFRIKPTNPGGKSVPHKDKLVYECIQRGKAPLPSPDSLLPGPEEPLALPSSPALLSSEYTPPLPAPVPLPEAPQIQAEKEKSSSLQTPKILKTVAPVIQKEKKREPVPLKKIWRIQVAFLKTKGEAEKEIHRLSPLLKDWGGRFKPSLSQKIEVGPKGPSYRVFLGPFPSLQETQKICDKLKMKKIRCSIY